MSDATLTKLKRDEVQSFVDDAKSKKKNKRNHVKAKVEELYPELVGKKVRRNGRNYDAIEYLLDDLDSYA